MNGLKLRGIPAIIAIAIVALLVYGLFFMRSEPAPVDRVEDAAQAILQEIEAMEPVVEEALEPVMPAPEMDATMDEVAPALEGTPVMPQEEPVVEDMPQTDEDSAVDEETAPTTEETEEDQYPANQ